MSRTAAPLPITRDKGGRPATTLRLPAGFSCDISVLPSRSLISTQDSLSNSSRIRPSPAPLPPEGRCDCAAGDSTALIEGAAGTSLSAGGAAGRAAEGALTGGGGVFGANLAQRKAPARHS